MATWLVDSITGRAAIWMVSAYIVWYIVTAVRSWYHLRHIPGPILASFSYLWGYFAMKEGLMDLRLLELVEKYGKLVRIGPNEVLVGDSETIWHMNNVRSKYRRGAWYGNMKIDPYDNNMFSELNVATHDGRKAKLAAGYTGRGSVDFEEVVDSQLAVLVNLLKTKYIVKGMTKAVDFGQLILYFQVDLISLAGFGEVWGDLPNETDYFDYISTLETFLPWLECISMIPALRDFFSSRFFLRLAGPKTTDQKGMGKVLGLVKDAVAKRFDKPEEAKSGRTAILDEWLNTGLTRRQLELELSLIIPAGTETTSTTIRGTMFYLLSTPRAYRKLHDEITLGIQEGRISSPITNKEAKQLPYLQAVINEGFRMMPPITTGLPKRVPAGGDTICGQFVPGGTDVFVHVVAILRNKETFGPDVEIFRPERFLECSEEKANEMIRNVELIFGYGRYGCPGQILARLEMNKIFVEILRACDAQLTNPSSPWRLRTFVSHVIDDFWVSFSEKA